MLVPYATSGHDRVVFLLGSSLALFWFLFVENVKKKCPAGDLFSCFLVLFLLAIEIVHVFQKNLKI